MTSTLQPERKHYGGFSENTEISQKIFNMPYNPDITLLGIYPKAVLSYHSDTCSKMLIESLLIISRN